MKQRLIAIVGPTAVGKTKYSLAVAKLLPSEIISGDSVQVYRGMDIGSAKATPEERSAAVHHMIDILNPDEPFAVSDFQDRTRELIAEINGRGRTPLLVGGTGLYVESVVYGYQFTDAPGDEEVRARWSALADERGTAALHAALSERDPVSASRIHANDRKRLIRALEIIELTGGPLAEQTAKREKQSPYDLIMIGLTMDRALLYERIEQRVDAMVEEGLVEEVRNLLGKGYGRDLVSMQAIGYKEIAAYVEGDMSLDEAVTLLKRNTRRFAKRQLSWFRTMPQIHWIDVTDANFGTHMDEINDIISATYQLP
ncbi:tRNA (adenosine(37)-N6)-dimethylallyltransferase MiaA [Paenibacillus thermotolerans]|uniref:tRNA (adenosine(37)-N6)-dimethylallyltransferase MiaA n=1 Tax=Paenibacillus thermotolerans TaxID=3027807 RepID=UPI00236791F4|nr:MULTISPECIES: tRNA (adenosine(37)-N6)-dimethylallyltransferase MiaA [unclassified Paenibacillus]